MSDSNLPFGSGDCLGLGFFVIYAIVLFELFGSPVMRSCQMAISLLLGYLLASLTSGWNGDSYSNFDVIYEAPTVLFVWTKLPTLIGYGVSIIETYGDSTGRCWPSPYFQQLPNILV